MNNNKNQYKVWIAFGPEMVVNAKNEKEAKEVFGIEFGFSRVELEKANVEKIN